MQKWQHSGNTESRSSQSCDNENTHDKHINNALREELEPGVAVAKFATPTPHGAIEGKSQTHQVEYYNLDMIISVGYRVKSARGVEFRRWANNVLRQYIIQGYAANEKRLAALQKTVEIQSRMLADTLDIDQRGVEPGYYSEKKWLYNIVWCQSCTY